MGLSIWWTYRLQRYVRGFIILACREKHPHKKKKKKNGDKKSTGKVKVDVHHVSIQLFVDLETTSLGEHLWFL